MKPYTRATDLCSDKIEKSSELRLFYTGLSSHATFEWVVKLCGEGLPCSTVLKAADVLLLCLMKLRINATHKDLSYRFGISQGLVSSLLTSSLPILANTLKFLIQ